MAGWEIALVIVAVTFMMVNMIQMIVSLKMMKKFDGLITKSVVLYEKLLTYGEKALDDLIEEEDEL